MSAHIELALGSVCQKEYSPKAPPCRRVLFLTYPVLLRAFQADERILAVSSERPDAGLPALHRRRLHLLPRRQPRRAGRSGAHAGARRDL